MQHKHSNNTSMKKIAIKDILVVFLFFMAFPLEAQVIRDDWSYYFRMTDLPNRPAGFIYRTEMRGGPESEDGKGIIIMDSIPVYDVYSSKGKKSRCVGIITETNPPRVVFELNVKGGESSIDVMERELTALLGQYGWDTNKNINLAFVPQKNNREFLEAVAEGTEEALNKALPYTECIAYDFHSRSGLYKANDIDYMDDILRERANQKFIDKQARKAKYLYSPKYADIKERYDAGDPETIEFVSKYLTWAGKWDKEVKWRLQKNLRESKNQLREKQLREQQNKQNP
mgnify:CR=1 FL=1